MGELGTLIATRNLFVNSDEPAIGECRDASYNLPQGLLQCSENQHMRVTLNSFSIRNSWYRVNQYNNTMYLVAKYAAAANQFSVQYTSRTVTGTGGTFPGAVTWAGGQAGNAVIDNTNNSSLVLTDNGLQTRPVEGDQITLGTAPNQTVWTVGASGSSLIYGESIVVPPGNYTSFEQLCDTVRGLLDTAAPTGNKQFGGVTFAVGSVTWSDITNKITIEATFTGTNDPEIKFVCFTINPYEVNSGSIVNALIGPRYIDAYQNSYELFGGCYENRILPAAENDYDAQFDALKTIFVVGAKAANKQAHVSSYNATLQTEENIYLRTNLHSSSFQTAGFDTGTARYPAIVSSQILAKIPLNNPQFAVTKTTIDQQGVTTEATPVTTNYTGTDITTYERPFEMIYYQDNGNDMYSILLSEKKVSQIRLYITDSFGRLWPAISQGQIDCGKLNFTASLRVDVYQE